MCCFILSLHFPHSLYLFGCIQFENILGWKKENLKLRKLEYKFLALKFFSRKIQAIPWKCCKCIVHHRARTVGNQKRMFTFLNFDKYWSMEISLYAIIDGNAMNLRASLLKSSVFFPIYCSCFCEIVNKLTGRNFLIDCQSILEFICIELLQFGFNCSRWQ